MLEQKTHYFAGFPLVRMVQQMARVLRRECDFRNELSNMERYRVQFAHRHNIVVPKAWREYSGLKLLAMEYIPGVHLSNLDALNKMEANLAVIAQTGAQVVLESIFEHGYFHGDPHPGNFMVLPGNRLCLLDFGQMGFLTERNRDFLFDLTAGFLRQDSRSIIRNLQRMGLLQNMQSEQLEQLESEMQEFTACYAQIPMGKFPFQDFLNRFMGMVRQYHIQIPAHLYLLLKVLMMTEALGRKLDSSFSLSQLLIPVGKKYLRTRYSPTKIWDHSVQGGMEFLHWAEDFPVLLSRLGNRLRDGRWNLEIKHKGMQEMLRTHDQISNRIAFAIVLASLIIGSSLIIHSDIPPHWHGVPLVGMVGFIAAALMGFWLVISILRHGKM
jgi:ubiquinone biosynthesis protein